VTHRGGRNVLDPRRPYGWFAEEEPDGLGGLVTVSTVLLTNRECPWQCVMCDLWRNTLEETVPEDAIAEQLRWALPRLPPARRVKLYNAGSFFDPKAIPPAEHAPIAELLRGFERVIVECHPALVGPSAFDFRDRLGVELEVALGLETAHPDVLPRLGKGMTLEQFRRAARLLTGEGIGVRAFVLVGLPYLTREEALEWAVRSADYALDCGAAVVSLIPLRDGEPALAALPVARPDLRMLEEALEGALAAARPGMVVLADLWDLERLPSCASCALPRRARIGAMNRAQRTLPGISCAGCA